MSVYSLEDIANLPHVISLFYDNVDINLEEDSGCWLWNKSVDSTGYGKLFIRRISDGEVKGIHAHRFSYLIFSGSISSNLCVLHNCPAGDNQLCCNPYHLWLGTKGENNTDMFQKGRGRDPRAVSDETREKMRVSSARRYGKVAG